MIQMVSSGRGSLAAVVCLLVTASACGRIGFELVEPVSDETTNTGGVNFIPDAMVGTGSGGQSNTGSGGAVDSTGGAVSASGGVVISTGGAVASSGGAVSASGGSVSSTGGQGAGVPQDSGTGCTPLTPSELGALTQSQCEAFTPCPGQSAVTDQDADGAPDACDACPNDASNDEDGDGYCGAVDNCPMVANANQTDLDADGEGDACDADDDNDGVPDASDNCPLVANPSQTNTDGANDGGDACDPDDDNDGTADGSDGCPFDPLKASPGSCGCGVAETCQGLIDHLVHRYRFEGTGSTIIDSTAGADGTSTTSLSGSGALSLPGTGDYATLPSQLVSGYSAVTIEFWITWQGGSQNQHAISFGTATPASLSVNCNGGSYCTGTSTAYNQGSWYRFCTARTCTWEDASNGCRNAGGYLVAIDDAQEQDYIANHPDWAGTSLWLGGNDRVTEGEWYQQSVSGEQGGTHFWSGGVGGSAPSGAYANWDTPEPDDSSSTKDCSFMYNGNKSWWAWDCTGWGGHAVCEWHGHQSSSLDRGVWFTPSNGSNRPSLGYKATSTSSTATASSAFPTNVETHVALVLDPAGGSVALYINGALANSAATSAALAGLRDGDNWLGRSQISTDPDLNASMSELRFYDTALSAAELDASYQAGPDPSFLP